jgi:hypothetical protein
MTPSRALSRAYRSLSALALPAVGVGFGLAIPLAGVGVWSLLTDPAVAADVAASGDFWPLARAIAETLGVALGALVSYL